MDKVWLMVMGVNHGANDARGASIDAELPLSTEQSYASSRLQPYMPDFTASEIEAVRFYCDTTYHDSIIHFYTTNEYQRQAAIDGNLNGNNEEYWVTNNVLYSDHTARLPNATTYIFVGSHPNSVGFARSFLFITGGAHYAAGADSGNGAGTRFECDDFVNNDDYATTHQVWVSFADHVNVTAHSP